MRTVKQLLAEFDINFEIEGFATAFYELAYAEEVINVIKTSSEEFKGVCEISLSIFFKGNQTGYVIRRFATEEVGRKVNECYESYLASKCKSSNEDAN